MLRLQEMLASAGVELDDDEETIATARSQYTDASHAIEDRRAVANLLRHSPRANRRQLVSSQSRRTLPGESRFLSKVDL